jgi:hypothetical protein
MPAMQNPRTASIKNQTITTRVPSSHGPVDMRLPRGLPTRQANFICLLVDRPSLTRADYQRLIGVSYATAKRHLAELCALGWIDSHGTTRSRRYSLNPALLPTPPK